MSSNGEKRELPHHGHCEVRASDATSPHCPVLSLYKQELRNRGQDGGWVEGGRLVPRAMAANHFVLLSYCWMRWLCSWAAILRKQVLQCLLSAALLWTLATILGHQTNLTHRLVADIPVMDLNSIFTVIAEPACT